MEKAQDYALLASQAEALLAGVRNRITNAANLSALIFQHLPDINWAGFYFLEEDKLVLGPFQGKPACVSIPLGRGVCGTAAATGIIQRVRDVHEFDDHLVCDIESRSELVIPLVRDGQAIGVLDLDSPLVGRFDAVDERGVSRLAEIYLESIA